MIVHKPFDWVALISFSIITLFTACAPDSKIRALYSHRPCPQQIVMNTDVRCIQSEPCGVTFEKQDSLETSVVFEKKEQADCPYTSTLASFKWEPAVYFNYKKHHLDASARNRLTNNVKMLKSYPASHISIRGFTDNRGNHDYNQRLANRRALSTFQFLNDHGITEDRMILSPVGETAPLLPNKTEENMAVNRRVEMLLLDSSGQPIPYVILTREMQTLLNPDMDKHSFCKIWENKVLWYPGIFFHSTQINLDATEMDKFQKNIQTLKNHPDFMVSVREFVFPDAIQETSAIFAQKRIQFVENALYTNTIEKHRIQVVPPEDTRIFQSQMSGHHSNQTPCVEMLLLDHKAQPFSVIVTFE
ncbi:MAG: OmpA family protein [Candidatus Magnetomorum sp.]|nr:OmpA family protein [Candidatus Magnetomorum sp.]